ncbi:MAG: alpha/beta fold hydrolase [Raineya sp.]|jgi:hypothetical protein|nr:alpha/beta fold hydrolase [Raineya sp.]
MRRILSLGLTLFISYVLKAQDLDPKIYDAYLGTYKTSTSKEFIIGRSFTRLFLFDSQTSDFRGLYKINDTTWYSGQTLMTESREAIKTITFHSKENKIYAISIQEKGLDKEKAYKSDVYKEENISFQNEKINLSGTLLIPNNLKKKVPAVILIHGSGEQNRHGYASYMRIIADHLAKNGIAVFSYDKRGSGTSTGSWQSASFKDLASDALKAYEILKKDSRIDADNIGFGGSSQAGWILAKITTLNPKTPFVFCISGAGMGIAASEQNIYNTSTELRNLGIEENTIQESLNAWKYVYRYVESYKKADAVLLDKTLEKLASNKQIVDFLPPFSKDIKKDRKSFWFQALEVNYNPMNDWKNYQGKVLALFGELDASTPVERVYQSLTNTFTTKNNLTLKIYPKASHLLMRATKKSDSELGNLTSFEPMFLPDLSNWILSITNHESFNIQEVKTLERKWLDAYENADMTSMNNIVDSNFLITFPNGATQTKADIIKDLPSFNQCCKNLRIYTNNSQGVDFGNVVILRGVVTSEWVQEGKQVIIRQRYTDTYIKSGNTWKVVASHLSDFK